jgi:hypothetical protein
MYPGAWNRLFDNAHAPHWGEVLLFFSAHIVGLVYFLWWLAKHAYRAWKVRKG